MLVFTIILCVLAVNSSDEKYGLSFEYSSFVDEENCDEDYSYETFEFFELEQCLCFHEDDVISPSSGVQSKYFQKWYEPIVGKNESITFFHHYYFSNFGDCLATKNPILKIDEKLDFCTQYHNYFPEIYTNKGITRKVEGVFGLSGEESQMKLSILKVILSNYFDNFDDYIIVEFDGFDCTGNIIGGRIHKGYFARYDLPVDNFCVKLSLNPSEWGGKNLCSDFEKAKEYTQQRSNIRICGQNGFRNLTTSYHVVTLDEVLSFLNIIMIGYFILFFSPFIAMFLVLRLAFYFKEKRNKVLNTSIHGESLLDLTFLIDEMYQKAKEKEKEIQKEYDDSTLI